MKKRFESTDLSLKIPVVFDQLKGEDADFEMVTSNSIKPLRLFYTDNKISHAKAVIFVNTGIGRTADITEEKFYEDFKKEM